MHDKNIGFIGAGNMSSAIIGGLVESGYPASQIMASNPGLHKLELLQANYEINISHNNVDVARFAEILILGVKPYNIVPVCEEIVSENKSTLVVSVAAGMPVAKIQTVLGSDFPVVRAMPNTPSLLAKGATGLFASTEVCTDQSSFAEQLFQSLGIIEWFDDESMIDLVTALSGSGPAYFFYLTEAMTEAASNLGMNPDQASRLARQTALGAAHMMIQDSNDAASLRKAVTSPNGTTAAALSVMDEHDFRGLISETIRAAFERGQQIAGEK